MNRSTIWTSLRGNVLKKPWKIFKGRSWRSSMTAVLSSDLPPTFGWQKTERSQNRCSMSYPQYTPYTDVNEILHLLLVNVKEILKDQFLGMYLYGSLSSGDFNPETSDVDFLVVTKEVLSE